MIILHRVTAILIGLATAGLYLLITYANIPLWGVSLMILGIMLMYGRMLNWEYKSVTFWVFLGTPLFFLISGLFFHLFLEASVAKTALGVILSLGLWLYAENLFTFYHLPSSYQAYALEYLSFMLFLLGIFFYACGAYAAQLFMTLPIWVPGLAMFWFTLFAISGVFWVSKIPPQIGTKFAWVGSILLAQLFVTLSLLPTSLFVNAATFALLFYMYLGISRIHLLDKLSNTVLWRYLGVGTVLALALLTTASWT